MYSDIALQVVSLVYVLVLSLVYFSRRRYNFIESKIYRYLLVLTALELVFEILKLYNGFNFSNDFIRILSKLHGISLFLWLILFAFYTLLSRSNNKYESFKALVKGHNLLFLWVAIALVMFIVLVVLEVWFNFLVVSSYDDGIVLVYILGIVISLVILINLMFNNKEIPKYKNYAILFSVVMLLLINFIQFFVVDIPVMSCGICLVTLFQYFTMENPDLKYIDELNALKNKAEEANQAKTNFLASMSHDIRTPMNAIIGLSETLLNSNLPAEYHDDIKNINDAGNTLLEIVNNILDITRVEAGKMVINKGPYSLIDVINKLTNVITVSLSEQPIKFTVDVVGSIPKLVNGDETKVYQILMNILSNAVKYTKKGFINFTINSVINGDKVNLTFKIEDSGIGIRKADNDKLFEKFERLDQEQSDIQGTGLGLVITKKLLDLMGGKISFESVYQQGTTFTITLQQDIVDNTQVAIEKYDVKHASVESYFDGSNYKILLVDDNLLNLKVAEKLLKNYKFQITSLKSGLEFLNYTKHNKYDLIFLDHMMPEMDGIHTLYNMKKRATGFDTPVVVLTANAIEGSKEMYLKEGFVDYLSKPINQLELDRILREQLKISDDAPVVSKDNSLAGVSEAKPVENPVTNNNVVNTTPSNVDSTSAPASSDANKIFSDAEMAGTDSASNQIFSDAEINGTSNNSNSNAIFNVPDNTNGNNSNNNSNNIF